MKILPLSAGLLCSTLFTPTRSEKSGTPCTSWGEHIHRVRHKKLLCSHLLMADYSLYGRARAGYFILETLLWWSKKKEGRTALEQQQVSEWWVDTEFRVTVPFRDALMAVCLYTVITGNCSFMSVSFLSYHLFAFLLCRSFIFYDQLNSCFAAQHFFKVLLQIWCRRLKKTKPKTQKTFFLHLKASKLEYETGSQPSV